MIIIPSEKACAEMGEDGKEGRKEDDRGSDVVSTSPLAQRATNQFFMPLTGTN